MTDILKRPGIDPPADFKKALKVAYVSGSSLGDNVSSANRILERARLYSDRLVSCSACDGVGYVEPKPELLAKWGERLEMFRLLMSDEEFETKFPKPVNRECSRCKGTGTSKRGKREVTVRQTGSSVIGHANPISPTTVILLARASRIAQRVQEMSYVHAIILRIYYGEDTTLDSLAGAHGRLVALYPLTDKGQELLQDNRAGKNPWKFLSELRTLPDRRKDDDTMSSEAQAILQDATNTWNDAVNHIYPNWADEQRRARMDNDDAAA